MTDWAKRTRPTPWLASAAALMLVGCGTFSEPNEVITTCPTTVVLASGETLERYRENSQRDLTDLKLHARIGDLRQVCSIRIEERALEMDLALQVLAERGPATPQSEPQRLSYFVAVVDPEDRIVSREAFPLELAFPGNARQAMFREELYLKVPVPAGRQVQDFRVVVGLQLTRDELERALAGKD